MLHLVVLIPDMTPQYCGDSGKIAIDIFVSLESLHSHQNHYLFHVLCDSRASRFMPPPQYISFLFYSPMHLLVHVLALVGKSVCMCVKVCVAATEA